MFRHTDHLQFDVKPEKPDPVYARKLQELIGGAYGEMTVTMQYLFQGWNCRMPGKYKDMIMDVATEEIGHVEMIATMVARLLEGAPATESTKNAAADPVVAAVLGGMDPQQAIVSGGGATLSDSNGVPWNGRFIIASGNLLADFQANVAAEAQGRVQTARLYNMTDDPGVKDMLRFNLARDTYHQNLWLAAIEELKADGIEPGRSHRTHCSTRSTPSTRPACGTCPTAPPPIRVAGRTAPAPTARPPCRSSPTPSRWATWRAHRRRTPSCTRPTTGLRASPVLPQWERRRDSWAR